MLHELIYLSTSVPAEPEQALLDDILAASRKYNAAHGITGVLLHESGQYLQLLEGEREAVRRLYYDNIVPDPRHRDARVTLEHAIDKRSFATWAMGYARLADLKPDRDLNLDGYIAGGIAALDLNEPASYGRRLLIALYYQMQSKNTWQRVFGGKYFGLR